MCAGNMGCLCLNWVYTAYEWIFVCANVYLPLVCFLWVHPVCISVSSVSTLPTNWLECGFVFMCPVYQAYINVCVCVWSKWARVLPSAWVATLSAAELSPWPLLLWATTLKRYLVSGMRFWMVTCISPGRLVFTTRSLIGGGWVARRQVTEQLIILTLNYPEGFV